MNKTRLQFHSVSEIVGTQELGLIFLTDECCERQITIVCDKAMAVQLELRAKHVPIVEIMLPEVLSRVLKDAVGDEFIILITHLMEGQYRTLLMNTYTLDTYPIRASDGVLLSVVGNIPLYIETQLMLRQSVPFSGETSGINIPVNTLSNDMLDEALKKAIQSENYELASQIRDEKNRRTGTSEKEM